MKQKTKWFLAGGLSTLGAAGILAVLVLVSGLAPLGASSGHWSATEWVLRFAMRRAVATHSIGIEAPSDLDDPGLIARGAGHYEAGCRFCHGSPGERMPRVPASALPSPPRLTESVEELSARELFWIVKHGIKLTGMPAWPASAREDEVWAVVAFLRTLPSLDRDGYRALTQPALESAPAELPEIVARECVRCHAVSGIAGIEGAFPRLAGQKAQYLEASLHAYASGARDSGIMEPIAARLDDEEMRQAASWYAARASMQALPGRASDDTTTLGARIAHEGLPSHRIPPCAQCHGPHIQPRHALYPRLAGQEAWYIERQLRLFRDADRGGTHFAHLMSEVATDELDDDMIQAVAAYYASLLSSD